jgi:hypothetical protein
MLIVMVFLVALLITETVLVDLASFTSRDVNRDLRIFEILLALYIVFCTFMIYLLRRKIIERISSKLIQTYFFWACALVQVLIIVMLLILIIESIILSGYHLFILKIILILSYSYAIVVLGFLCKMFLSWLNSSKNLTILLYTLISITFLLNVFVSIVYVMNELTESTNDQPFVVARNYQSFVLHIQSTDTILQYSYVVSSITLFIVIWISIVFFLKTYSNRIGRIVYTLIIGLPLLFFLIQYLSPFISSFVDLRQIDPIEYFAIDSILGSLGQPLSAILIGLSFIRLSKKVDESSIKDYMVIAGIGLVIVFTANHAELMTSASLPPFGILSNSLIGISSYLFFIGISTSAIILSNDKQLRAKIRASMESDTRFLIKIASAETERMLLNRALKLSKQIAVDESNEFGVTSTLNEEDLRIYVKEVLQQIRNKSGTAGNG